MGKTSVALEPERYEPDTHSQGTIFAEYQEDGAKENPEQHSAHPEGHVTQDDFVREPRKASSTFRVQRNARYGGKSKFRHEDPHAQPRQVSQASISEQDAKESGDASRRRSKLEFSDEELPEKKLRQAQRKAERTAQKLEKAEESLPSRRKLRMETEYDTDTGRAKKRLKFEKEVKPQAAHVKGALPLRPVKAGANAAIGLAHQKVYQAEEENVGTKAAHRVEMTAEAGLRTGYHLHKTAPYRKVERLRKRSAAANANAAYQQVRASDPKLQSNFVSRMAQKHRLKRQYAKTVREARRAGTALQNTAVLTRRVRLAVVHAVKNHPVLLGFLALLLALMLVVFSTFSAFSNLGSSIISGIASSSYLAEDQDIDQAELIYTEWETDLREQINNIERDYPDYDVYRYDIGSIGHDPYQLMAFLTAKFRDFQYADIRGALRELFDTQYTLTLTEKRETNSQTGEEKKILDVKLTSKSFSRLVLSQLDEAEREICEILMDTQGNRQYVQNVFGINWLPYVSSHYGYRIHPITGKKTFHSGVDIGMGQGTDILAGQDGVVSLAGEAGGYGLCVVVDGSIGGRVNLSTKYAHCSRLLVSVGQEVKAGDVIAKVGSTGNSTGPHLHLEVLLNGQTVNPLYFADTGANIGSSE